MFEIIKDKRKNIKALKFLLEDIEAGYIDISTMDYIEIDKIFEIVKEYIEKRLKELNGGKDE